MSDEYTEKQTLWPICNDGDSGSGWADSINYL
jgi:hypothetical protein